MADDCQTRCPSQEALKEFNSGGLPDARLAAIADHVAGCDRCEKVLESLDCGDTTVVVAAATEMRRWQGLFEDPTFRRLDSLVRSIPFPDEAAANHEQGAAPGAKLTCSIDTARSMDNSRTESWEQLKPNESEGRKEPLPEKIGRYFVVRRLGEGGFGTVYLAKDPVEGALVAIKVPKPGKLAGEQAVQSFLGEARTAAELAHPGIVQVKDWGRGEGGGCYVVMDYIEGRPLIHILQTERLSLERAAMLTIGVAEALHFAHRRGIYHRDIKPGNIMIDTDDQPHVADFGLAISETERWQHRNEVAGTLPYMAPEQACGDAHVLDGRTDIYSLGVVLFRLLTGQLPFRGDFERVKEEILKRPPPVLRTIDERIPAELERICLKCLAKEAVARYPTALDLAEDLKRWLDGQGSKASSATAQATPPRPKQLVRALLAIVLVTLVVGLVAYFRPGMGPGADPPPRDELPPPDDPFGWKEKLGELPSELIWPGYRGTHAVGFRENPPCLELTSDYPCLVRLGEFSQPPRHVSIGVRQPVWGGWTGLFLGYREAAVDGRPRARFHAVFVENVVSPQTGHRMSRLAFHELEVTPDLGLVSVVEDLGNAEFTMDRLDGVLRLELQFDKGRLSAIRCGDAVLNDLSWNASEGRPDESDLSNPWGVFHKSGTTWFSNPLTIREEG